mmetsp:Transcript_18087/g.40792  ORF Transcript_18087/g.40792 Transcript_18087/m.40792 type:complete len:218 (-) Transcript_18087:529-1182(-)
MQLGFDAVAADHRWFCRSGFCINSNPPLQCVPRQVSQADLTQDLLADYTRALPAPAEPGDSAEGSDPSAGSEGAPALGFVFGKSTPECTTLSDDTRLVVREVELPDSDSMVWDANLRDCGTAVGGSSSMAIRSRVCSLDFSSFHNCCSCCRPFCSNSSLHRMAANSASASFWAWTAACLAAWLLCSSSAYAASIFATAFLSWLAPSSLTSPSVSACS